MQKQELIEQAIALHSAGQLEEAAVAYELAISQNADHYELYVNLANVLRQLNRLDEAEESVRQAIAIKPNLPIAWGALSRVLWQKNQKREAIEAIQTAIKDDPNLIPAYANLIAMLREMGEIEQAVEVGQKALLIDPNAAEIMINLSYALKELGQVNEALTYSSKAAQLRPDLPHARINHGSIQLLMGDYEHGFIEREKYLVVLPSAIQTQSKASHWNGQDITGKRLLIYTREGIGDTIMYARYLKVLIDRGIKVIVQVPKVLTRLMQQVSGLEQVIESLDQLPVFDHYIAFPTLPAVMKTRVESIPQNIPYLFVLPGNEHRLGDAGNVKRIGLVWSGSPANTNDTLRSIPYEQIKKLSSITAVKWFSLQKDNRDLLADPHASNWITDLSPELNDFSDTASIIEQLDLVITVDTSVAHLAGGLGKPVWILLRYSPDWRWMMDREDSPWYPSARLLRQSVRNDWGNVIDQIKSELK